jgi:fibronectin type 3 domain-containing protein
VASTSPNVSGYNIYRATTSGGPYAKLNSSSVAATSYVDSAVQSGQTYYYVVTAVDSSSNESAFSNQAQGVIPSP